MSCASEAEVPSFVYQSQPHHHQHQRSYIHAVSCAPAGLWTMAPLAVENANHIRVQRGYEPEAHRQREDSGTEDLGMLNPLAHTLTEYSENPSPSSVPRSAFKSESQVCRFFDELFRGLIDLKCLQALPLTHCQLPQPLLAPVPVRAQTSAAVRPVLRISEEVLSSLSSVMQHQPVPLELRSMYSELANSCYQPRLYGPARARGARLCI